MMSAFGLRFIQFRSNSVSRSVVKAVLAAFFFSAAEPAQAQSTPAIDTVIVTGVAPLPGTAIDIDKMPGEIETLSVSDLTADRQRDVVSNVIATQLASVSLNDEQGSQFQPDFVYHGFEASPVSGVAEGIAVYQNGIRLNESFGDNVNWDLIPEFAVNRFTLQSNNPVFGLNALGGAVALEMKDGFQFNGLNTEISGGSFGNITGNAEYGTRFGNLGFYIGLGATHDDGFRYQSPTTLRQAYGDLAYEQGPLTLHLSISGGLNDIAALGPTPVEMLAQDRRSVFTYPQAMRNEAELVQVHGTYQANDTLEMSFSTYYRHFRQRLIDGNTTDVNYCNNNATELCLEGNYNYPGDALYDTAGNSVSANVLGAGATPGETDFTHTNTDTLGAAAQASSTHTLLGHENSLVVGASIDNGITNYNAYGELGTLTADLKVIGSGVIIDQAQSPTARPPIEAPVNVDAHNTYVGAYAIDVFNITPALTWNISGRLNAAQIGLMDRLGDALNASHGFTRFNPGTGLTYKISDTTTLYGGYSQSNRAPTAGELSCADPTSPCLLDAFLVSDPNLKQVVSHDYEAGLRGGLTLRSIPGSFTWKANFYRTNSANDILLLATDINGFGYFQNSGTTRRQGVDLHVGYTDNRLKLSASYSYLEASFLSSQVLASNSPAADSNGLIYVQPGNHIPMNPTNRITLSADFSILPAWSVGADLRLQNGEYLVGDQSNQEPKLPGYFTVALRSAYQINDHIQLFGEVKNLFDQDYYTYGTFAQLDGLPPNFNLADPRTFSPAPGRSFFAGIRAMF